MSTRCAVLNERARLRERLQTRTLGVLHGYEEEEQWHTPLDEERPSRGCLRSIGAAVLRLVANRQRRSSPLARFKAMKTESSSTSSDKLHACTTATSGARDAPSALSTALFGMRGRGASARKTSTPLQRLQEALCSIQAREADLSQRALDMRSQASIAIQQNQKPTAIRLLRRSKQLESQAQALAKTSVAVERQADMLEEADLQQEVASALKVGVNNMKKASSALKTVESLADDAQELGDEIDDINNLLTQIGQTSTVEELDDDVLLAELMDMQAEDSATPTVRPATESAVVASPATATLAVVETPTPVVYEFPSVPVAVPQNESVSAEL